MDPSLNTVARQAAAETAVQLVDDFCRLASRRIVLKRLEGAFVESVRAYVEYTLAGENRNAAKHLKKAHAWIDRVKELNCENTPVSAPRG